jgi:outer membrane porin, OprD family
MRNPDATQLSPTRLLWLALVPIALILSPATARSDEPGRTLAPEDARDQVWRSPFFKDTTLDLHPRTYYFVRDNFDGSKNQAWAGGGWLAYHSGLLGNIFHIGANLYTSQPIVAPDNEGGTLLLTSEQDPINTLGIAYLGAKFWRQDLIVGRQFVDTPLINRRDNRMIPITFEGATIRSDTGKDARFEYITGYLQVSDRATATTLTTFRKASGSMKSTRAPPLAGSAIAPTTTSPSRRKIIGSKTPSTRAMSKPSISFRAARAVPSMSSPPI